MKTVLCTLVLNEMEWLDNLYRQHCEWPGMVGWIFVEAADLAFATANPDLVKDGLSTDGTTEFLSQLQRDDKRVQHIPFGVSSHSNPDQGKVAARNAYLQAAKKLRPDRILILDADEFYTRNSQEVLQETQFPRNGLVLPQRHIWQPPSLKNAPMFSKEVIGGYWDIPHCRVWKWQPRMHYSDNHNTPHGYKPGTQYVEAQCIHLGFASSLRSRAAKHRYYVARGEGREENPRVCALRRMYVECRRAFETYQPGDELPHGAQVVDYLGPVPEVFQ